MKNFLSLTCLCSTLTNNQAHNLTPAWHRLSMTDAPVPYASSMEIAVVKRGSDVVAAVSDMCK